ncbi:histidine triad nucleotide-binding protein [Longimicrobium sp.]|uniref:histidine triad nucleotide-binding protein n=1 Tax=Longimicrobium sp. TaxID=2029185 RepID=UPI002BA82BA4|nr:histidine triad nucleotide-binding protein [Longimicrobium sp.]HSU15548.1 histidine triad nucleotide-binding protein [Longimicrobium sp.]
MSDCIFCRIVAGEIPSQRVLEGGDWIAIRDINPAAPTHVLVIPRRHVDSIAALEDGDGQLAGALLLAARDVARHEGVAESGYRTVINTGAHGGQTVAHLHVHVIGGRQLTGHGTA